MLLNGPMALIIKFFSEIERKKVIKLKIVFRSYNLLKALASTTFKIKATDIVASHKIVCSVVAFPVFAIVWTAGFNLILKQFTTLDSYTISIATLIYLIFWPIYSYGNHNFYIIMTNI